MNTQRAITVTIAIVLLALLSLANLLAPLILPAEAGSIIYSIVVLGVLGLVGAAGGSASRVVLCFGTYRWS